MISPRSLCSSSIMAMIMICFICVPTCLAFTPATNAAPATTAMLIGSSIRTRTQTLCQPNYKRPSLASASATAFQLQAFNNNNNNNNDEEPEVQVNIIDDVDPVTLTALGFAAIAFNFFVFANAGDVGIAGIVARIINTWDN